MNGRGPRVFFFRHRGAEMNDARGEAIIMASGQGGKGDEEKGLFFKFFLLTSLSILPASSCARMTPALPEDASMMSPGGKPKKKKKREKRYPQAFRCWKDFIINKWRVCNWNRVMMLERRTGGSYRGGGGRVVRKSAGVCYYFTWRTLL